MLDPCIDRYEMLFAFQPSATNSSSSRLETARGSGREPLTHLRLRKVSVKADVGVERGVVFRTIARRVLEGGVITSSGHVELKEMLAL